MGEEKGLNNAILDLFGEPTSETSSGQIQPFVALFLDNRKSYLSKAREALDRLQKLELDELDDIIKQWTLYTDILSFQVGAINECSIENHCSVLLAKYSINLSQKEFEHLVATIENAHLIKCIGNASFGEPSQVALLREIMVKIESVEQIRQLGFVVSLTTEEIEKVTSVSFGSSLYKFTLPLDEGIHKVLVERHELFSFCVRYLIHLTQATEKQVRDKLSRLYIDHAKEIKTAMKLDRNLIRDAYLFLKESTETNVTTKSLLVYELLLKCYNWPSNQKYNEDNELLDTDQPAFEKYVYDKIRYYVK